jgi:hypothetical protein
MENDLSNMLRIARTALLFAITFWTGSVFAGPARCSYGNQDSTCITPIAAAPQPQPECSTAAGWTTTTASTWIGSKWTAPSCHYQPPPSCAAGYTETTAPTWTGSYWTAPGCILAFSPVDQINACTAYAAAHAFGDNFVTEAPVVVSPTFTDTYDEGVDLVGAKNGGFASPGNDGWNYDGYFSDGQYAYSSLDMVVVYITYTYDGLTWNIPVAPSLECYFLPGTADMVGATQIYHQWGGNGG